MKLIKLTNRYYFLVFFVTLLVGGIIAFFITSFNVNKIYQKKLIREKQELLHQVHKNDSILLKKTINTIGSKVFVKKLTAQPKLTEIIKDTLIYSAFAGKAINHKMISFLVKINAKDYNVCIAKPLQAQNNIILLIFEIVIVTAMLLFFSMLALTSLTSKKIWKPFYDTISKLESFNVEKTKQLNLLSTDILEFKQLNSAIEHMTSKVEKDYRLLKEYTENVSHEIQTPLAIIKNKIELLLQDQTLERQHLLTLAKLHQSTGRLSKLSKNLAVLTKIENNQFVKNTEIYLTDFIKERLEDFEELIALKQIKLDTDFQENPKLLLNTTLAYLLFNNLISNAVRHNINKGIINIVITENKFEITNTGNPLKTSKMHLFNRFAKSTDNADSTGLGLALVKKIIAFYGFYIAYKNESELHTISIIFIDKKKIKG